jgi:hypothetical protein
MVTKFEEAVSMPFLYPLPVCQWQKEPCQHYLSDLIIKFITYLFLTFIFPNIQKLLWWDVSFSAYPILFENGRKVMYLIVASCIGITIEYVMVIIPEGCDIVREFNKDLFIPRDQ